MKSSKVFKNSSWLIGVQIAKALIGFAISMLTARYLGPSNFGLINYAASVVSFFAPIMYLGINNTLVQEIIYHPDKEGETLGTAITMSFVSSLFCILGTGAFVMIANSGETETLIVCALYSILLIFQSLYLIQYWFQAKLLSKYSSLMMLFAYIIMSAYRIFLLIKEKGLRWFAVSNVIEYFIISFTLLFIFHKISGKKLSFSFTAAKRIISRSKYYIMAGIMVSIFAQTDRIMLKIMVNDAATGFYSAGAICAGITGFVFAAIIDSFRPLILENKNTESEQYENNICRLYTIIIYFSLMQCVFITAFAKYIVQVIYGPTFGQSVNVLRIIVWYTTFSYLGAIRNIWMLAENKQKYIWLINTSGAIANVALNFLLIPFWGIMGAAIASLITQIFTNFILGFIVGPIRYNNILMLRSLNPKYFKQMLARM